MCRWLCKHNNLGAGEGGVAGGAICNQSREGELNSVKIRVFPEENPTYSVSAERRSRVLSGLL